MAMRTLGSGVVVLALMFWHVGASHVCAATDRIGTGEAEPRCFRLVAVEDLSSSLREQRPIDVDAGERVTFRLTPGSASGRPIGPAQARMRIDVFYEGNVIRRLPESFYLESKHLASGPVHYWIIKEYTGGMYCCTRYHLFGQAKNGRLHYVGATHGSSLALDEEAILCSGTGVYLKDLDSRFLYFHTPQAFSRLLLPIYYRLALSSLAIDNKPFRRQYLQELAELEDEIADLRRARTTIPPALLLAGDSEGFFSEELGQLLVRKALLHLYGGNQRTAWSVLERDLMQYYGNTKGLVRIKAEIRGILKEGFR